MSYPATTKDDAWQRRTQRSFARNCYALVSIPAFLAVSLIVTAALMLTVVMLTVTAILRFVRWLAGSLIFRSQRRSNTKQRAIIRS
jgi:hypothetical protein